jgi:hypothetical protein
MSAGIDLLIGVVADADNDDVRLGTTNARVASKPVMFALVMETDPFDSTGKKADGGYNPAGETSDGRGNGE